MDTTLWSGLMGFIGALMGGAATYFVGIKAASSQKERDRHAEAAEVRATLRAIRDEIKVLSEVHLAAGGGMISAAPDDSPIAILYPISNHYFTAFEANAAKIGKVEDEELRTLVVTAYIHFKSLVDSVGLNNHLIQRLELAEAAHRSAPDAATGNALNESLMAWQQAADYAPSLKASNARAMKSGAELLVKIDQWLSNLPTK